jgi:hypothetical protein
MPQSRNRRNAPPTGEGKSHLRRTSAASRARDRSEVAQAQRNHPEVNIEDSNLPGSRGDLGQAGSRRKAGR